MSWISKPLSRRQLGAGLMAAGGLWALHRPLAFSAQASGLIGGAASADCPFELLDNRIFVETWINGAGPFAFIFDTGGTNILAPHVVDALALQRRDSFSATGGGAGEQTGWRVDVSEARIGPALSRNTEFISFSLDAIQRAIGLPRLDGVFGHELLRRFVVAADYDQKKLIFAEPDSAPPALFEGDAFALSFVWHLPRIEARLDERSVTAMIDTGDRSSLTLLTPFVERNKLREVYTPSVRAVTGWGVGGPILADVARAPRLTLGGSVIERAVARMAAPGMGAFSGTSADVSIGGGVLKRFSVTFDYPRSRMILRKSAAFSALDPMDRSGMWLTMAPSGSPDFRVEYVVDNGPASRAGLRKDDIIIAVDGVPSSALSLLDVRSRLMEPERASATMTKADGSSAGIALQDLLTLSPPSR